MQSNISKEYAVCTLYEGHYHYGVAALTNSLYYHGFRGSIYIGYRGSIPFWSSLAELNPVLNWNGGRTLQVGEGISLHFLPIETGYHLTNYKPSFMLKLWEGPATNATALIYFDPDIIVRCNWHFFEAWLTHGVAVVHDITDNDMPQSHPIRLEWANIIHRYDKKIERRIDSYINAGFCGLLKKDIQFLNNWEYFIEKGIKDYNANPRRLASLGKNFPFCFLDQDALNITAMCSEISISEMGPAGMDFVEGGWTMSHATGAPKPWKKNFFLSSLAGNAPSKADKSFWAYIKTPIHPFSTNYYLRKKTGLLIASFISRFYRRN